MNEAAAYFEIIARKPVASTREYGINKARDQSRDFGEKAPSPGHKLPHTYFPSHECSLTLSGVPGSK